MFKYYYDVDQTEKEYSQPGLVSFDGKINIKPEKTGFTSYYLVDKNATYLSEGRFKVSEYKLYLVKEWRNKKFNADNNAIFWFDKKGKVIKNEKFKP